MVTFAASLCSQMFSQTIVLMSIEQTLPLIIKFVHLTDVLEVVLGHTPQSVVVIS